MVTQVTILQEEVTNLTEEVMIFYLQFPMFVLLDQEHVVLRGTSSLSNKNLYDETVDEAIKAKTK